MLSQDAFRGHSQGRRFRVFRVFRGSKLTATASRDLRPFVWFVWFVDKTLGLPPPSEVRSLTS